MVAAAETDLTTRVPRDEYSLIGPPNWLHEHYGMGADGIPARARAREGRARPT
jgi:hypothetical protein